LKNSRKKFYFIFLFALGNNFGLAGFPALHFGMYGINIHGKPGRTTINDSANCRPVRFAKSGEPKYFPKSISRHKVLFGKCKYFIAENGMYAPFPNRPTHFFHKITLR